MKKYVYAVTITAIFLFLLLFPQQAVEAASNGLLLWFHTIIPTLLPFIILSSLLIKLNAIPYLTSFIFPLFHKLFGLSKNGCYAVLIGFLCGYPMGAKITADLLREEKISALEAQFLLSFCNNVSPMFSLSFIIQTSLKCPEKTIPVLCILYLPPFLYAFCRRRLFFPCETSFEGKQNEPAAKNQLKSISFSVIDSSIMNGFATVTKLGGYIILFSIISMIILTIPLQGSYLKYALISLTEITCGTQTVCQSNLPEKLKFLFVLAGSSFGGFSSAAQTNSMITGTGLKIGNYLLSKTGTMLLTILFLLFYLGW